MNKYNSEMETIEKQFWNWNIRKQILNRNHLKHDSSEKGQNWKGNICKYTNLKKDNVKQHKSEKGHVWKKEKENNNKFEKE